MPQHSELERRPASVTRHATALWLARMLLSVAFGFFAAPPVPGWTQDVELVPFDLDGTTELEPVVKTFSRLLDVRYLSGADLSGRFVTIEMPRELPREALPFVLDSLLQGLDLAVVDSGVYGWKRIVELGGPVPTARNGGRGERELSERVRDDGDDDAEPADSRAAPLLTRVFELRHPLPAEFAQRIRSKLTGDRSNVVPLPDHGLFVVTDTPDSVRTLGEELKPFTTPIPWPIRRPRQTPDFRQTPSSEEAPVVEHAPDFKRASAVEHSVDSRDPPEGAFRERPAIARAVPVDEDLSVVPTRLYRLRNVSTMEARRFAETIVRDADPRGNLGMTVEDRGDLLVVRAPAETHRQVKRLLDELDRPIDPATRPIRAYRLGFADASDVAESVRDVLRSEGSSGQAESSGWPTAQPANVSIDEATNSVIIDAPANFHRRVETLIRSLDRRRPQVLIEAIVMAVGTGHDSSFDGDGTVVEHDVAESIIETLAQRRRGRVIASSKILVQDNETGTLESVTGDPSRDASGRDVSTGPAAHVWAGTTVTVKPRVDDGKPLRLDFEIEIRSLTPAGFTDARAPAAEPRLQTERLASVVTVPDGMTVIAGGRLSGVEPAGGDGPHDDRAANPRDANRTSIRRVAWVDRIPFFRKFAEQESDRDRTKSVYVFIRPRVLGERNFRDLEAVSEIEAMAAGYEHDGPSPAPILIP